MKEAIIVNLDGHMIDVALIDAAAAGVFPIYEQPEPGTEAENEESELPITGYKVAVPVPPGLYKPRFDFAAWEDYLQRSDEYLQELVEWLGTPEEDRGDPPTVGPSVFWVEGLTQEELDAILNPPPEPPTEAERDRARLADLELMMADLIMGGL